MIKNQHGFTLIELVIVIMLIGALVSVSVPAYRDYMIQMRWCRVVAEVVALKLAVTECLTDSNGKVEKCNTIAELANYGITDSPSANPEDASITITSAAGIKITGLSPLGFCTSSFTPRLNRKAGIIVWTTSATGGTNAQAMATEKCRFLLLKVLTNNFILNSVGE